MKKVILEIEVRDLDILREAIYHIKDERVGYLSTADTEDFKTELVNDIQALARLDYAVLLKL